MAERAFLPHFKQTMDALIAAGQMSVQDIDKSMPYEDQKITHELRNALIDAFISMINGIKSPSDGGIGNTNDELTQ